MLPSHSIQRIYWHQVTTLGFYFLHWCARGGGEVNRALGRKAVPSAWWFLVPFFGPYWWMWQYAEALDTVSRHAIKKSDTFLLFVIACNLWVPFIRLADNFPTDWLKSLTVLVPLVAVFLVATWLTFGVFCSVIQKKINQAAGQPHLPKQR